LSSSFEFSSNTPNVLQCAGCVKPNPFLADLTSPYLLSTSQNKAANPNEDTQMTDIERRNIERVKHWEQTWNNAVDRMIDECYAEDCEVINMLTGYTMRGREALRAIEHAMLAFDGTRRMEITRILASGDTVALEAIWGDKRTRACVFLTFNSDGMIVSDHSYGSDPSGASSH
jgi:hypothetical protein